jgi:hypothetical protein
LGAQPPRLSQAGSSTARKFDYLCKALGAEILPVSTEATALLSKYVDKRILGPKYRSDMLHIAIATISAADVLVSWNFRHIVRRNKIRFFKTVSLEYGYKELTICSPREVVPDEAEEENQRR